MLRVLEATGVGGVVPEGQQLAAIGELMGYSVHAVRNWVKRGVPTEALLRIAQRTGAPLEYLMGESKPLSTPTSADEGLAALRSENDEDPTQFLLARLMGVYGADTLQDLAHAMGENLSTVKGWKQRGSVPLEHCVRAWRDTKRSLDWIVLGLDSAQRVSAGGPSAPLHGWPVVASEKPAQWLMHAPEQPTSTQAGDGSADRSAALLRPRGAGAVLPLMLSLPLGEQGGPTKDYEVIPRHLRYAAAGIGVKEASESADQVSLAGDWAFSHDWLRQNLANTSGQLSSVRVRGDSMATTLLDGDTILIDEGVTGFDVDGIYVFDYHGRRLVKRMQQMLDGTLLLISDNTNYQRETVPRDRARDVQVIGRMVWPRVR